ncbi:Protein CBG01015 [Caenorhabditis briggsae]|uniref:Protein CBG01015 n=1 Tax=Caenorhabditis briggsae TaxID=6238 RepID=A8WP38_CAEBR|nr:Protein CBG01015 [Caenorhabditis briggsae]CAP22244.1 Protein CBG01015 [Caenorhabditis briggsae]
MQSKSPVVDAKEQMKKKTPEELAQMAIVNRAFSAESSDDPPPLLQKRSDRHWSH